MSSQAKPPQTVQGPSSHDQPSEGPPTIHVLYLRDDSSLEALLATEILETTNSLRVSLQEVVDRDTFVQALRSGRWEVILLDSGSTALRGEEAVTLVLKERPEIPVIMLTRERREKETTGGRFADERERKEMEERVEHIARFPGENPHPILRVAADGKLSYANPSSSVILKAWGCSVGEEIPGAWKETVRHALKSGENQSLDVEYGGRTFNITVVPIATGPYVNLYGRDITERQLAEVRLEQTNQKINHILASIQEDFYVVDRNWTFVYANERFSSKLGKQPEDLVGRNLWEAFPKHVESALGENFRAAMEKREIQRFEVRGEYTNAWYAVAVYPSEEGITVLGSDITEQKKVEAELRRVEREKAEFFESIQTPFYGLDSQWRYTFVNQAAASFMRKTGEELLGKSLWEVFPQVRGRATEHYLRQVMEERVPAHYETQSVIDEIWSDVYVFPKADGGLSVLYRDISDRKEAEERLRESEERFRTMADSTPVMIWVTNAQGDIVMVNRAYEEFFGVTEAEVKPPGSWKMLVHPDDETSYIAAFTEAVEKRATFSAEGRVSHRSGQWHWIRSYGAPRFSREGKFLGHVGSSPDITAEKSAADALKASELNLRLMVSQASDGMMVVGSDGTIESVSALGTRILGYDEGDLLGRNVAEFAETFSRLDTVLTIERLRKNAPKPFTSTARVKAKDGCQIWLSVTASLVSFGTRSEKFFVKFQKLELRLSKDGQRKEEVLPRVDASLQR